MKSVNSIRPLFYLSICTVVFLSAVYISLILFPADKPKNIKHTDTSTCICK